MTDEIPRTARHLMDDESDVDDRRAFPLSERVVAKVAETMNVDPTELDPLYEAVDADALDALFSPKMDGTPRTRGSIDLTYCEHRVSVGSDGTVDVRYVD